MNGALEILEAAAPVAESRAGESNGRSITAPRSFFSIPPAQTADFGKLRHGCQQEVLRLLDIMEAIHKAPNPHQGAKAQAALHSHRRGYSAARLRARYDAFMASGDWRCLMNRTKAGVHWQNSQKRQALPLEFVDYWKELCEHNQRCHAAAYRVLIRQWERWLAGDKAAAIPGYKSAPPPGPNSRGKHPAGWNVATLARKGPSPFEKAVTRQGRSAAAKFRPKVLRTREGMAVGQLYQFDDMWHDFLVNVLDENSRQREAKRLLQLHCLDVFSGCSIARGYKPITEDLVTGKSIRLREVEMRFLLVHVLAWIGYHPAGCLMIVEHGTAAVPEELRQAIYRLTDGLVTFDAGGIQNAAAFAGAFGGAPKGNFRIKAHLESLGKLIHNELADTMRIPGQTGSNARVNGPEELYGRQKLNGALLRAMEALAPELRHLIGLPFLECTQGIWLAEAIQEQINRRIEHDLQGWLEAGLFTHEYRLSHEDTRWLPVAQLQQMPDDRRRAIEAFIQNDQRLQQTRRLSPHEVYQAGKGQLLRISPEAAAVLMGPDAGQAAVVHGGFIALENPLGGDDAVFLAEAHNRRGRPERFHDGEQVQVVVNPHHPDRAYLWNMAGDFLGLAPAWNRIRATDVDALHRQYGKTAKIEAELLAPVARRGAALVRQRIQDAKQNADVLAGRPVTPEDKAEARRLKASKASLDDFLEEAPEASSRHEQEPEPDEDSEDGQEAALNLLT